MPSFAETLASGKFVVTTELTPPKGTDARDLVRKAESLRPWVDAFNLTDSAGGIMTMAPIAPAKMLRDFDLEPIMQMTASARNRMAIQSDMLAAAALGVRTMLFMGGDPPGTGDHPDAKPVFDLDAITLLNTAATLADGKDLAGHALKGAPQLFPGAVANPGSTDLDRELKRMREKVDAGARFFQTQAVYDVTAFEKFMDGAKDMGVPVIAGYIVLKSGDMARRLNATLPGVHVPESLIEELDAASDKPKKSLELAGRTIAELMTRSQGVHIMAIGWESRIPELLANAGIVERAAPASS